MKKLPMRRLLVGLAIFAGAVALAVALLSLPWHGDRPFELPVVAGGARGGGTLRAGAASVSIDLPPGVPIGGYARLAWKSEGQRDPVGARAIYVEVPGCRVAVVSADILLVSEPLAHRVEALVSDLRLDAVLVGAAHTHAGPGGYREEIVFERAALGPYDARVFALLAERMAEAVRRAVAISEPARVAIAHGTAEPLVKARHGGHVGGRMTSIRLVAQGGAAIGELLVLAAHPTILGKENRRISGEWPGRVAAQPGRGVRVIFQGALGDQSVRIPGVEAPDAIERYAAAVVERDDALAEPPASDTIALAVAATSVTLPPLSPGAVPGWLRRAVSTVAWRQLPAAARVTALRIGDVVLVTVPAEPTEEVAERWRTAAGAGIEVVSLVGGYAGYVETPERTSRGEGESALTYYGRELAARLESAIVATTRAVQ